MKAHIISNATMAPLVRFLEPIEVTVGDYDSLVYEMLDANSTSAAANDVSHVLAMFDSDTLLGVPAHEPSARRRSDDFLDALAQFCQSHPQKTIITHTFCAGTRRVDTFSDLLRGNSVRASETAANQHLIELAKKYQNLAVFDLSLIFRRYGEAALVNPSFWYAGRIRYTPLMFEQIAITIKQLIAALSTAARKVLILDLDNTLWGGIVGEVGAEGIALSEQGVGAVFRDFQRGLKALKNTGVLLAICSKNNPADVDEVFEKNAMMLLKREDFAAIRVNWEPKPKSIAEIVEQLNVGFDSVVFIDDNAVEREMVQQALPGVMVPSFPSAIDALPSWLVDEVARPLFAKYRVTSEDISKTEQYHANEARKAFAKGFDLRDFVESLLIEYKTSVDDPDAIVRASQLTQKTNQFNLTTLRCDIPMIREWVDDPNRALVTLSYSDRFGSEGIVALAMLDFAAGHIASFLMSCRVIGRHVEDHLLEVVVGLFRARGVGTVRAEYLPTAKNEIVSSFYEGHGFSLISEGDDGRRIYERDIDGEA